MFDFVGILRQFAAETGIEFMGVQGLCPGCADVHEIGVVLDGTRGFAVNGVGDVLAPEFDTEAEARQWAEGLVAHAMDRWTTLGQTPMDAFASELGRTDFVPEGWASV